METESGDQSTDCLPIRVSIQELYSRERYCRDVLIEALGGVEEMQSLFDEFLLEKGNQVNLVKKKLYRCFPEDVQFGDASVAGMAIDALRRRESYSQMDPYVWGALYAYNLAVGDRLRELCADWVSKLAEVVG